MRKVKYKLSKKNFEKRKATIYILPTIVIVKDDMLFLCKNISVYFHWLIWHGRLVWLEDFSLNNDLAYWQKGKILLNVLVIILAVVLFISLLTFIIAWSAIG